MDRLFYCVTELRLYTYILWLSFLTYVTHIHSSNCVGSQFRQFQLGFFDCKFQSCRTLPKWRTGTWNASSMSFSKRMGTNLLLQGLVYMHLVRLHPLWVAQNDHHQLDSSHSLVMNLDDTAVNRVPRSISVLFSKVRIKLRLNSFWYMQTKPQPQHLGYGQLVSFMTELYWSRVEYKLFSHFASVESMFFDVGLEHHERKTGLIPDTSLAVPPIIWGFISSTEYYRYFLRHLGVVNKEQVANELKKLVFDFIPRQ